MYKSNKELLEFADKIGFSDSIKNGRILQTFSGSSIQDSLSSNPFFNIVEALFKDISFKEALELVAEIQSFSNTDVDQIADYYDTSYPELSISIPLAILFFWYKSKGIEQYTTESFWEELSTSKDSSVQAILRSNCVVYYIKKSELGIYVPEDKFIVYVDFNYNYSSKKSTLPKKLEFNGKSVKVL